MLDHEHVHEANQRPLLFKRWIAPSTGYITIQPVDNVNKTNPAMHRIVTYPVNSVLKLRTTQVRPIGCYAILNVQQAFPRLFFHLSMVNPIRAPTGN